MERAFIEFITSTIITYTTFFTCQHFLRLHNKQNIPAFATLKWLTKHTYFMKIIIILIINGIKSEEKFIYKDNR